MICHGYAMHCYAMLCYTLPRYAMLFCAICYMLCSVMLPGATFAPLVLRCRLSLVRWLWQTTRPLAKRQ
eukprot:8203959-Pyramimonas_sp.AAC.1